MVMPLDIITIIVAVPVVFGHGIVSVYLAFISVADGVFFGSDSAVVPTVVATVFAVMNGILLTAHVSGVLAT